jgi:hypothetical protein
MMAGDFGRKERKVRKGFNFFAIYAFFAAK